MGGGRATTKAVCAACRSEPWGATTGSFRPSVAGVNPFGRVFKHVLSEDVPGAADRKAEDQSIVGPFAEDDNAASGRYGCAAAWSGFCETP